MNETVRYPLLLVQLGVLISDNRFCPSMRNNEKVSRLVLMPAQQWTDLLVLGYEMEVDIGSVSIIRTFKDSVSC